MKTRTACIAAAALALAACVDADDTSTDAEAVLQYPSNQGTVDYGKSDTGTYLKVAGDPMTKPVTVYFIFYGGAWTQGSDTIDVFHDFIDGLSGSPLASVLASYDDDNGNNVPNAFIRYGTDYYDSTYSQDPSGKTLTAAGITAELDKAVSSGTLPKDSDGIYVILPDRYTVMNSSSTSLGTPCNKVCGWHPKSVHSTYTLHGALAVNPNYCESIGYTSCDFDGGTTLTPNDHAQADAMVNTIWHETAEALTDPDGNGYWIDTNTGTTSAKTKETADQCEGTFGQDSTAHWPVGAAQLDLTYTADNGAIANTRLGNRDFLLQPMWQNADRGGCVRRLILNRPAAAVGSTGATGDLDANGVSDFLWRNDYDGSLMAITLDASDGTSALTTVTGGSKDMHTQIYGFADFTGDGSADLLWRNLNTGKLTVWSMGGAVVQSTATLSSVDLPSYTLIKAVGDFDGNGKADILFQDADSMVTRTWFDTSWAAFDANALPLNSPSPSTSDNSETIGTGDFDGDGRADVLWHDLTNDTYRIWRFTGTNYRTISSTSIISSPSTTGISRVIGIVDVDRNGTADLIALDSSGANVVWLKMTSGVPGAKQTILATPSAEWRFSGGVRSGIGGAGGLLWYNRKTGAVARWRLDSSGHFVTSSHLVGAMSSNMQLVSN
jgi:hypothetical protein